MPVEGTFLTIDYTVKRCQLLVRELNKIQRAWLHKLLDKSDNAQSRGFQEVIAYEGRDTVVAMGGYWEDEGPIKFFQVTSFGGHLDGEWIYTHEDGVVIRPPKPKG